MSLDVDANHIQEFCPNCGEELLIRISQAMDIWNEKKEIRRKDVKYSTQISDVKEPKVLYRFSENRKNIIDIRVYLTTLLIALIIFFAFYNVVL